MLPQPQYLTLDEWAAYVVGSVTKQLPSLSGDWKAWANDVIFILNIDNLHINPYNFNKWQDWAERFIGAYDG